jgi:hypothetical protein
MIKRTPFRYLKTSPEIIRLVVNLYIRVPLLLCDVENKLHESGNWIRHERASPTPSKQNQYLTGGEGWISGPSPPPLTLAKSFSQTGCGRIFSLSSRVMHPKLTTAFHAGRPKSGLSVPVLSGPDDCVSLMHSF